MDSDIRWSRPEAAVKGLSDTAMHSSFRDKKVLLTGEASTLLTPNGKECFLSSFRLMQRLGCNIDIDIPDGFNDLANNCKKLAALFDGRPTTIERYENKIENYDAVLNVGHKVRQDIPWTAINANGWVARVSSGVESIAEECGQANPVAALAAACLGVTEVFKRLIALKESRGKLFDATTFSLMSYECGEEDPGPPLPTQIDLNLALVGMGALGNGIVHLLRQLPISGYASIVDPQKYEPENLGTSILLNPRELSQRKACFGKNMLRGKLHCESFAEGIETVLSKLGTEFPYPRILVNGLDAIEPRHAAQETWADIIIDGGTSDFACQVSRHPWRDNIACLQCLFNKPIGESSEELQGRATGLSVKRLKDQSNVVNDKDIKGAPIDKRQFLRENVGKPFCSVVSSAVTQLISEEEQSNNFEPSVPFVACLSASMVVGELVKFVAGWDSPLKPLYQMDVLMGPMKGQLVQLERKRDCKCVKRAKAIEIFRKELCRVN